MGTQPVEYEPLYLVRQQKSLSPTAGYAYSNRTCNTYQYFALDHSNGEHIGGSSFEKSENLVDKFAYDCGNTQVFLW